MPQINVLCNAQKCPNTEHFSPLKAGQIRGISNKLITPLVYFFQAKDQFITVLVAKQIFHYLILKLISFLYCVSRVLNLYTIISGNARLWRENARYFSFGIIGYGINILVSAKKKERFFTAPFSLFFSLFVPFLPAGNFQSQELFNQLYGLSTQKGG